MARTQNEVGDNTTEKKPRKTPAPRPVVVLLKPSEEGADCPVTVVLATRDAAKALEMMANANSNGDKLWFVRADLGGGRGNAD